MIFNHNQQSTPESRNSREFYKQFLKKLEVINKTILYKHVTSQPCKNLQSMYE